MIFRRKTNFARLIESELHSWKNGFFFEPIYLGIVRLWRIRLLNGGSLAQFSSLFLRKLTSNETIDFPLTAEIKLVAQARALLRGLKHF